ncbi:MAG TPA: LuxR C-terminal-related transcriptional regulator [Cyclobacteriaceae bacterium]|nr:LuxR C-terminal-related transcriptional regulator [Cyclobacteriaceae bacterium]
MRKTILIYGASMAGLIGMMKYIEYRYLIRDFSIEFYVGVVAIFFTMIGIWAGFRLTRKKVVIVGAPFALDEDKLQQLGISRREYEVLELIAVGHSNQEIADKLFVSVNTVKTHLANLFLKLDVSRRTQAIQKAKSFRLIP